MRCPVPTVIHLHVFASVVFPANYIIAIEVYETRPKRQEEMGPARLYKPTYGDY